MRVTYLLAGVSFRSKQSARLQQLVVLCNVVAAVISNWRACRENLIVDD